MSTHRLAGWSLAAVLAVLTGPTLIVSAQDPASSEPTPTASEEVPADDEAPVSDETATDVLLLPPRPGPAPSVTDGIPHIQQDQTSSPEVMEALAEWAFSLPSVAEQPSRASLPGARALTLAEDLVANEEAMIVGREFAHIHADPGAGSLHLRLPEDEAGIVVDAGWGVWHPFALEGSMPGMIMVFAPRDAEDLETIQLIVAASVEHAGG